MKLANGSYFYQIDDLVYLRNVKMFKNFLFSGVAYDILKILSEEQDSSAQSIASLLSEEYECDAETILNDVENFLEELYNNNLLELDKETQSDSGSVADKVLELYMKNDCLFSVSIELTYRCNERCIHCYIDGENNEQGIELSLSEYKTLLDKLKTLGCIKVLFTGGEVFLKENFIEIVEYATSLGFLVDIFTNGYFLTPEYMDKLIPLNINSLSFSLYGGTAHIHDAITGIKGSFEKTLNAVTMTKCAGIDTYIKTVCLRQNIDDMQNLLELGKRLNIDITPGYIVLDKKDGYDNSNCRIVEEYDLEKTMSLFGKYQPYLMQDSSRNPNERICSAGKSSLHINPFGDIMPCISIPITLGNVRKCDIQQVWHNNEILKKLSNLKMKDVCSNAFSCSWIDCCGMCLGRCDISGEKISISDDICVQAHALYNVFSKKRGELK